MRCRTEVLAAHSGGSFATAVSRAVAALRAGDVVALPTETVYGLAANACDERAVARIFSVKGRPANNPIIVHVTGTEMARQCVSAWTDPAQRLAEAFWPGPLTIVLPKAPTIPDIVTAGGPTVGVRCPRHPLIQAVMLECGFPLAAPSANRSTALSPTRAEHVCKSFDGLIPLILDGGPTPVGIESTVLDLTRSPPRVLRPGIVHHEALSAVLGPVEWAIQTASQTGEGRPRGAPPRSPGQLARHYAPQAPLVVLAWNDEADLRSQIEQMQWTAGATHVIAHTTPPGSAGFHGVSVIPRQPEACARALYAELHRCDEQGAAGIVVEAVPEGAPWDGIADRLRRASARPGF